MGLMRSLHHVEVLHHQPQVAARNVSFMRRLRINSIVCSPSGGLFEPRVQLGDYVAKDQLAGLLHSLEVPWSTPMPVHFAEPGFVLCRLRVGDLGRGRPLQTCDASQRVSNATVEITQACKSQGPHFQSNLKSNRAQK